MINTKQPTQTDNWDHLVATELNAFNEILEFKVIDLPTQINVFNGTTIITIFRKLEMMGFFILIHMRKYRRNL